MLPLPHRVRRLSLQVRAASPNQALALRKEVRDRMDTTLIAAMERAFSKAGAPGEIVHIPRIHVRVRISNMDELAAELGQLIEQELLRQLSARATTVRRASLV